MDLSLNATKVETLLTPTERPFRRIYTFDLIRIFFVFAIVMLHSWEHFVGEDIPSLDPSLSIYEFYRQTFGVIFNYAALYALSLSFFLWGLKDFRFRWVKYFVFTLGFIGLQLKNPEAPLEISSWFWEVYGYLFVSVTFCHFWPRKFGFSLGLWIFSVLMLSLPLDVWAPVADRTVEPWRTIFFAEIDGNNIGGWFLIPWICVSTLAFSTGQMLFQKKALYRWVLRHALWLVGVFGLVSAVCYQMKSSPIEPQLGAHFYQFLFMQAPLHFWNHYLAFIGVVLLCLFADSKWDLSQSPLRYFSYLQWNQNFFLSYFFHFAIISFFLGWRKPILETPHAIDWLWLAVFLQTEILMQVFVWSLKIYKKIGIWFFRRIKT